METEIKYGIISAKQPEFPVKSLLVVPHKSKSLTVSYPAFGPNYFRSNIAEMQKSYSHPQTGKRILFREPATSESISAAAYRFGELAKPGIFDPKWLQLGYIVRTSEGVFANPPKNSEGNQITDEKTLKSLLNKAEKVNGIYLSDNDFGFAPYETFKQGVQDAGDFAESGLARLLERTKGKVAKNLKEMASPEFYNRGVNVWGFDNVTEPALMAAGLGSGGGFGWYGLSVVGGDWGDGSGYAFGVLKEAKK
ncbi:MAG: hypothetical protein AABY15_09170 [Nanoarchaeota archaeon]